MEICQSQRQKQVFTKAKDSHLCNRQLLGSIAALEAN